MHAVVTAHLNSFSEKFGIVADRDKVLEAFAAYSILREFSSDQVNPSDLTYEGDDPGIDSILIFIDDTYISSVEEVSETFLGRKRDVDVDVVFIQVKSTDGWNKKEITTFQSGVIDFLDEKPVYPHSEHLTEKKRVFLEIIKNVGRIKGGKPKFSAFFVTTGKEPADREILSAIKAIQKAASQTGYFSSSVSVGIGRDGLLARWSAAEGPIEATLPVLAIAAFPRAQGLDEGYVATVNAKMFVEKILADQHGKLRQRIFEENVRDFYGEDNDVNVEITQTLKDTTKQQRFGVMNNGVTIISSDVRVQSQEIYMRDFQIVNGCQTSNVLFHCRTYLTDSVTLMVKIIETSDASLVDDVVRSTNRQTKVQDDQFLATLNSI